MTLLSWYYGRTRSPFAELTRYFFGGLLRPESAAGTDSFRSWLIQILALLIAASWYFPVRLFGRYMYFHQLGEPGPYRLAYASDTLVVLLLMSLLVATLAALEWTALFPSRRDHLVLTPLPLTRLELFAAKLAALALFVTLFIGAITLLTGLTIPAVSAGRWEPNPLWLRMAALLAGAIGLCYFVFLALIAVQGLLMALLPVRWFESASFFLQATLLVALVCGFPLLPYFPSRLLIETHPWWFDWMPPAWFWGLARWMDGSGGPADARLAERAAVSLLAAFAIAATAYLVSYLQYSRYSLEAPRLSRQPLIRWSALFGRYFRQPQARAAAEFTLWTLMRGRQQKLVFLLIAGLGFALVLENSIYLALRLTSLSTYWSTIEIESTAIALPLTLSFFTMVGLRRVFRIPTELPANWLFRFSEDPSARPGQMDAVFRVFVALGGLPILLACAPLQFFVLGPRAAWALPVEALLLLALSEHLLQNWHAIPFTFAQDPGRRNVIQSATIHLLELALYSFVSATWIQAGLHRPAALASLTAVVLIAFAWLHWRRRREWGEEPLEFSESQEDVIQSLRLQPE